MYKTTLMIGIFLVFLQSLPLLADANNASAITNTTGQTDMKRISTNWIFANAASTKEMAACTEPRPQICSQDYRPVCAVLQDGSFKTYSNGCSACSDPAVTGYREGACE
jgi:hypothetical protein